MSFSIPANDGFTNVRAANVCTERQTAGRWNARPSIVVIRSVFLATAVYVVRTVIRAVPLKNR